MKELEENSQEDAQDVDGVSTLIKTALSETLPPAASGLSIDQ